MVYKLLYDKQILFDPYTGDYVTDAKLTSSVNAASYFDFIISIGHNLYDAVAEHAGLIELYFDKIKLFSGEISKIDIDIEGNKSISCTGAMDYLSDSLVRPYSTVEGEADLVAPSSVDGYFQWLIDQHNKHCKDSRKQFSVGVNQGNMLDANNYIYRKSDQHPTTASEIEDKILDSLGGYLFIRYQDDMNVLDLYADAHEANTQIIDFGTNITNFTKTTSTDDQYTAVVATGYTPDPPEDDPKKEMKPIGLDGCVDGGTPYSSTIVKMGDVVYDIAAVSRYGYKEYYASNNDITTYDGLLQYACKVLNTLLSPSLSITVNAVDLALYMDNGYEHMQIGQAVRVRSKLHKVDEYLMVNSITLDLNDPGNTEYQLGVSYDTLTGQQSSYLKSLNAGINSSLDSVASLDKTVKDSAKEIKAVNDKAEQAKMDAAAADSKADKASQDATAAEEKAEQAKTDAATAQGTADTAKANAATAQSTADTAKANAKTAQDAVDALKNRVTSAETSIKQNSDAITLRATKTELTEVKNTADAAKSTADNVKTDLETNYSTTSQMNSAIDLKADSITSTVSQTYLKSEDASKNYASSARVENIESKVTQTADSITATFNSLKKQIDDKTEVVNAWITEGSDGTNPYLELGTNKSDLKTRLTNSELAFMDGTDKVAYISNNTMSITNADIDIAEINQLSIFPYQLTVKNGHLLIQHIGG